MDARTHQFMDQLNTHLNTFFTLNYTCLKAGARSNPLTTNVGTDSFGRVWLEEKMQILADQRIAWMTAIRESVFDLDECGFNAAMDTFKVDFMKTFEEVYGPSGTFDDNFDGFKIKHLEFKKDFFNLDFLCKVSNDHPQYQLLCYNYLSFLNYYKQKISYESYAGIFSALASDLQSNGYKSFYFQRPDEDVKLVDEETIHKMHNEALDLKKRATVTYKSAIKKHNKTYKKVSKPNPTEEAQLRFAHFRACYENEENQFAFVNELLHLTHTFEQRLKYANTPSNTTLKNTLYENFFDFVSGVNIFDEKNNYKADKVYIHRREFEYYNYLKNQIKTLQKCTVKENETQVSIMQ